MIQYPTIIGVGLAMWKTISEWYKENVLEYDGLVVKQQPYILKGRHIDRPAYCLRIIRKRGKGRAEDCDGLVTIEGTEINRTTVWEGDITYVHISNQGDLKLFEIDEEKSTGQKELIFRSNPTDYRQNVWQNNIPYTDESISECITIVRYKI